MNTQNVKSRIEELETQIEQAKNRKARADTRQQEANDQRDIDNLRAQLKELIEKIKMSDVFDGKVDAVESLNLGDSWELADCIEHSGDYCTADSKGQMKAAAIAINAYDANQERITELEGFAVEADSCVNLQRTKINSQQEEINALRVQIDTLSIVAKSLINDATSHQGYRTVKAEFMDRLSDKLDKTPQQCLAGAEADAFDLFLEGIYCHVIETKDLQEYSKKLRGNAK